MGLLKTKYLVSEIKFERIYRKEELEYPEEALREAIINAVIHRDYIGAHTQLKVYSDKIILWNDGGLPNEIKIEDLKKNHLSKPRNELLADIFFKAGLIETWGRGTIKITDECSNAGLPEPEFKEEFGEWLCGNVLKKVPRRHFVFSISKILRIYFLFNRSLLKELSKISWEVIKDYYNSTCRKVESNPTAVAVIQTFGDYLAFNPHMHILAADGCFGNDGFFYAPAINIDTATLEKLFIHKIFKILLKKGFITDRTVELICSWSHSGFGVYCGKRINPKEARSTENLARYIIRASFSQERMKYYPAQAKVAYQSKYGKNIKEFSALEWIAALISHIPDRGGQTLRYYGHYSNVTRGRLKKEEDEPQFQIIEDESPRGLNRSWARLIQKIYEVDPLICPRCGGDMRIIAFIEDYKIVKKILDYLGIYEFGKKRSPPKINTCPDEFDDDYIQDDYIDYDHVC